MSPDRSVHRDAARWEAIFGASRDAIICIDEDGAITLFNPAAERIFGYSPSDVLGENVRVLMPSPYREGHDDYLRRYRETGVARAIGRTRHVEARRRDGSVFPAELSVSESLVEGKSLFTAIIRDASDGRAAPTAGSSAVALRDHFAGVALSGLVANDALGSTGELVRNAESSRGRAGTQHAHRLRSAAILAYELADAMLEARGGDHARMSEA